MILTEQATVQLNPAAITTDVAEFATALRAAGRAGSSPDRAEWLAKAVELYRGELLPGLYDDWVLQERQWLAEQYFQALAASCWSVWKEKANSNGHSNMRGAGSVRSSLREEAHRDLIRLYIAAGQPGAALRQYTKSWRGSSSSN